MLCKKDKHPPNSHISSGLDYSGTMAYQTKAKQLNKLNSCYVFFSTTNYSAKNMRRH